LLNVTNPAAWRARDFHSRTTAREILVDFAEERLDYWVTGCGTGGTLKGVARVLANERPETKIIVCEPEDAQLLRSGIVQSRNADGTPVAAHPTFKPHPMQGWTPDFIPKLTDDAVAMKVIDRVLPISGPEAIRCSKNLARSWTLSSPVDLLIGEDRKCRSPLGEGYSPEIGETFPRLDRPRPVAGSKVPGELPCPHVAHAEGISFDALPVPRALARLKQDWGSPCAKGYSGSSEVGVISQDGEREIKAFSVCLGFWFHLARTRRRMRHRPPCYAERMSFEAFGAHRQPRRYTDQPAKALKHRFHGRSGNG
jgi:hypothetical protein